MNEYIVGITEQELEFYYNKSEGFSHYSELDEMERTELVMNTNQFIRTMMLRAARHEAGEVKMAQLTRWSRIGRRTRPDVVEMHAAKRREKASNDS